MRVTAVLSLLLALVVSAALCSAQSELPRGDASLRGVVTDPSGALVPGAAVKLTGTAGQHIARSDGSGRYALTALAGRAFRVRVIARGFSPREARIAD